MLSAFFLVNANGNALITRMIRDDLRPEIIDQFRVYVIQNPAIHTPMLTLGGITFLWIPTYGLVHCCRHYVKYQSYLGF